MVIFCVRYYLKKLNQVQKNNLNRHINPKKIETVFKILQNQKQKSKRAIRMKQTNK